MKEQCDFEKMLNDLWTILSNKNMNMKTQTKNYCSSDTNKEFDCNKNKTVQDYLNEYNNVKKYRGFEMKNIDAEKGGVAGVQLTYLVPGVEKSNLHVSLKDNDCIVTCDKVIPYFGKLDSTVRMKFDIDYKNVVTKYNNGVLEISLYRKKVDDKTIKIDIM